MDPIKQGTLSEVVGGDGGGEMVTKSWSIFGRVAFISLLARIGRGGLKCLFDLFNDALLYTRFNFK